MKKILIAIIFSFVLLSCDDGDITVTSFDLEDSKVIESVTFNPELAFNAAHTCDQLN